MSTAVSLWVEKILESSFIWGTWREPSHAKLVRKFGNSKWMISLSQWGSGKSDEDLRPSIYVASREKAPRMLLAASKICLPEHWISGQLCLRKSAEWLRLTLSMLPWWGWPHLFLYANVALRNPCKIIETIYGLGSCVSMKQGDHQEQTKQN